MLKLDMDELDVVDYTVAETRALIDDLTEIDNKSLDILTNALDIAQGDVFSGQKEVMYVLIRVTP